IETPLPSIFVGLPMRVTWKRPAAYTDKTPIAKGDLSGFEILVDDLAPIPVSPSWSESGDYSHELALNLPDGKHEFRVVAVSKSGAKSAPSEPFVLTIAPRVPNPPFDVAVSLTA